LSKMPFCKLEHLPSVEGLATAFEALRTYCMRMGVCASESVFAELLMSWMAQENESIVFRLVTSFDQKKPSKIVALRIIHPLKSLAGPSGEPGVIEVLTERFRVDPFETRQLNNDIRIAVEASDPSGWRRWTWTE